MLGRAAAQACATRTSSCWALIAASVCAPLRCHGFAAATAPPPPTAAAVRFSPHFGRWAPPASTLTCSARRSMASAAAAADGTLDPRAQAVIDWWFGPGWAAAGPDDARSERFKIWFGGGPDVDAEIVALFSADLEALLDGRYDAWATSEQPLEALAGVLLGDQLTRNAFRGTAKMYAADERVLGWSKALIASGADKRLLPIQRVFVYMPLMHSEALADQEECVARFEALQAECAAAGLDKVAEMAGGNVKYASAHRDCVAQWGRFPHRNAILGRPNTPEEAAGIAAGTIPKW